MSKHDSPGTDTVVVGQLSRSRVNLAMWWAAAAESAGSLSADCRLGSNGQWFAVVLDVSREPLLTSEAFESRDLALAAAVEAVDLIRATVTAHDLAPTN